MQDATLARSTRRPPRSSRLVDNVERVIAGNTSAVEAAVICLFADGNLLLEGVPGRRQDDARPGARALDRRRVQPRPGHARPPAERPDRHLASTTRHRQSSGSCPGPVFANVVLVDEINRTTPRTQSALLEPMEERQVTVEGITHPLPRPYLRDRDREPGRAARHVPAPRGPARPVRDDGRRSATPTRDRAGDIVRRQLPAHPIAGPRADAHARRGRSSTARRAIGPRRRQRSSTTSSRWSRRPATAPDVALGASPASMRRAHPCAQARAVADGRDYVLPDDVKALAPAVLAHRLMPAGHGHGAARRATTWSAGCSSEVPVPLRRRRARVARAPAPAKRAAGSLVGAVVAVRHRHERAGRVAAACSRRCCSAPSSPAGSCRRRIDPRPRGRAQARPAERTRVTRVRVELDGREPLGGRCAPRSRRDDHVPRRPRDVSVSHPDPASASTVTTERAAARRGRSTATSPSCSLQRSVRRRRAASPRRRRRRPHRRLSGGRCRSGRCRSSCRADVRAGDPPRRRAGGSVRSTSGSASTGSGDSMRHVHWPSTARTRRGDGPRVRAGADPAARRSSSTRPPTSAGATSAHAARRLLLGGVPRCARRRAVARAGRPARRGARGELDVAGATDPGAILEWLAALSVRAGASAADRSASAWTGAPRRRDRARGAPDVAGERRRDAAFRPLRGARRIDAALVDVADSGAWTARLLEGEIEALPAATAAGTFVLRRSGPRDDLGGLGRPAGGPMTHRIADVASRRAVGARRG